MHRSDVKVPENTRPRGPVASAEFAERLGVSTRQLQRYVRQERVPQPIELLPRLSSKGVAPSRSVYRWRRDVVDRFLVKAGYEVDS